MQTTGTTPSSHTAPAEWLRRGLLGLVTALIVARPLVLGEDPGLNEPLSDASGLVLTLLWLAAGVGWAVWRAWSRQGSWRGSAVEIGLLAVVVLVFTSAAGAARYQHPAWLIAWEWVGLLIAFCLVRQLARTPLENHCLLAALLASGVSLSVYAVYQYAVELPQQRQQFQTEAPSDSGFKSDPEKLRQALAQEGIFLAPNDPDLRVWDERIQQQNAFSTYSHPNAFAGYLDLLLPAAVCLALGSRRRQGWSWQTLSALACALLLGVALWLTHSRGGSLAALLVGAAIALIYGRRRLVQHKAWAGAGLAAVLVVVCVWGREKGPLLKARESMGLRLDYWTATWAMIRDHPWLGVGPGNFGRHYLRYMLPTAFQKISDPHNFALEIWATCGAFALIALLITLAAFFRSVARNPVAADAGPEAPTTEYETRWEFYLGGMGGLVLGFFLWASSQWGANMADRILLGAVVAGGRSLVWFAAFAALQRISWSGPSRVWALTAGVAALLLNLTVSGGISFPSVAQPLWIMMALALNALPWPVASQPSDPSPPSPLPKGERGAISWMRWILPLPLSAALCLTYFLWVFSPVTSCFSAQHMARSHYTGYGAAVQKTRGSSPPTRQAVQEAAAYLGASIVTPFREAVNADPDEVNPRLELLRWYEERMAYYPGESEDEKMTDLVKEVEHLDPEGTDGYLAEYQMWLLFAQRPMTEPKKKIKEEHLAAKALEEIVLRDPTEATYHYRLAELLFRIGDEENRQEAMAEAQKALDLDQVSQDPFRKLSNPQRGQVRKWLGSQESGVRNQESGIRGQVRRWLGQAPT